MVNQPKKMDIMQKNGNNSKIALPYVTVRQSIAFLLLRLISIEIIFSLSVSTLYLFFMNSQTAQRFSNSILVYGFPVFMLFVLLKIILTIYVVVQWVNEYYKITPREVIHKKGFLIRQEEKALLEHLAELTLEQGFFGKIFNFGTLKLFNWTTEKAVVLYLIHNPLRYKTILHNLLPQADEVKDVFREHVIYQETDE